MEVLIASTIVAVVVVVIIVKYHERGLTIGTQKKLLKVCFVEERLSENASLRKLPC